MKRRVILRPAVPDDLHDTVNHLEQASVAVADRFINAAFEAFDDLAEGPGKGDVEPYLHVGQSAERA